MRKNTIAIAIASILLGASAAHADPATDATSPATDSRSPAATMGDKGSSEASLGSTAHWTKADTNADGVLSQTELSAASPKLSTSFTTMDADGDQKLTQDEFKAWHKSHKGGMDADASKPKAGY